MASPWIRDVSITLGGAFPLGLARQCKLPTGGRTEPRTVGHRFMPSYTHYGLIIPIIPRIALKGRTVFRSKGSVTPLYQDRTRFLIRQWQKAKPCLSME